MLKPPTEKEGLKNKVDKKKKIQKIPVLVPSPVRQEKNTTIKSMLKSPKIRQSKPDERVPPTLVETRSTSSKEESEQCLFLLARTKKKKESSLVGIMDQRITGQGSPAN